MKKLLLLLSLGVYAASWAQPYPIGHKTITYNDPSRTGGYGSGGGSGRQIQCEVYYPATSTGDNVPFAAIQAPVITFGHGFVMGWDAYENIWESLVPQGYVLIFPRTEGNISPAHADFGKDLVVVANRFVADCANPAFFAFDHYNGKNAVMGHSMGGGSTLLAASDANADFDLLVGLAPAETNPSAISAAGNVTIPAVIFSGTEDAVTPPADHHLPIYQALGSSCKQFFAITGGAHCYFANSNVACDFGEGSSGGNISITREVQHDIMFDGLEPLLRFYLFGDCDAWAAYEAFFNDFRVTTTTSCNYVPVADPVIVLNGTTISTSSSGNLQWYLNGALLNGETSQTIDASQYGNGTYTVVLTTGSGCELGSNPIELNGLTVDEKVIAYTIYPVPGEDVIWISASNFEETEIALLDSRGRKLLEIKPDTQVFSLDISELASGVYHLVRENRIVGRVIKE
jgi:dienelactone hydrolase